MILPLILAVLDLGVHFENPSSWEESSVDFAVDRQGDGFGFASQKMDIVNCMGRGKCAWHGIDVWEARIYYGTGGAGHELKRMPEDWAFAITHEAFCLKPLYAS